MASADDAQLVAIPVFILPRRECDTVVDHPVEEHRKQLAVWDDDDVSIRTFEHKRIADGAELQQRTLTLEVMALYCGRAHRVEHGPSHCTLSRDVDELSNSAGEHAAMRDHCGDCRFGARMPPGLRHAHANRLSFGNPLQ